MMPSFPTVRLLEPFRVANSFGLFAVMTSARYEIAFQGPPDGPQGLCVHSALRAGDG